MMLEQGFKSREIAAKIGCGSHVTILNLKKKYNETNNVEDKHRSGRPRMLNERDERTVIRRLMTNECSNAVQLTKSLQINDKIEVCTNTVRRVLRRNGLMARV